MRIFGLGASVEVEVGGSRAAEVDAKLRELWSRCLIPGDGSITVHPGQAHLPGTVPLPSTPAGRLDLRLHEPGTAPISCHPTRAPLPDRGGAIASPTVEADDLATLLCSGTQAITRALLAAQLGRLLLLHAGAVSHPETGKALVFVAEGGTGKTTLARVLGRHYGYLTDESVAIDATHQVLPYPKPLSLRTPAGWPKQETSPDALGLRTVRGRAEVAKVILLTRDQACSSPVTTALSTIEAITAIAPQSSSLDRLPRALHQCADLLEATGGALSVRYAEAEDLLPLAADLIGAP